MPRFIYRQGDEFDGSRMPAEVVAFGIEFLKNQPTRVDPQMFENEKQFSHALTKLRGNPYFEEAPDIEDATLVEVKPKRERKPAPPPADEPAE